MTIAQTLDRGGEESRCEFPRWIFRTGIQGHDAGGPQPDPVDSEGSGYYGARVQFRECRLHEDRSGYGCDQADGRDREADGGGDEGTGFSRMRQAGGILQRSGR